MAQSTTIFLISCSKRKDASKAPMAAERRYTDPLFRRSLEYARTQVPDSRIFVLSGKCGLITLTTKVGPGDITIHQMGKAAQQAWGCRVTEQIRKRFGLGARTFVFLAGAKYADALKLGKSESGNNRWTFKEPLRHMGIGVRHHEVIELLGKTAPLPSSGRKRKPTPERTRATRRAGAPMLEKARRVIHWLRVQIPDNDTDVNGADLIDGTVQVLQANGLLGGTAHARLSAAEARAKTPADKRVLHAVGVLAREPGSGRRRQRRGLR